MMKRTLEINNTIIDLGNIKSIKHDCQPINDNGGYVTIALLKGKEYVLNEKNLDYELVEPKIKLYAHDYGTAASWVEEVENKWNKYLNSSQI